MFTFQLELQQVLWDPPDHRCKNLNKGRDELHGKSLGKDWDIDSLLFSY